MTIRDRALEIVGSVVPSDMGDAKFTRIIGDMYHEGPNAGTTCGFLPSFMWLQLGITDPRIINRNDPSAGLTYKIGENVSTIVNGAKALGAWRPGAKGIKPGDVYFISNGPPATEHVEVFVAQPDPTHWKAAAAGQTNAEGHQAARYVVRDFDGTHVSTANGPKVIQGYVDLEALPYASPPADRWGPVALIVGGTATVALITFGVVKLRQQRRDPPAPERKEAA